MSMPKVSEGAAEIYRSEVTYPFNHYFAQVFAEEMDTQEKWDEMGFMYLLSIGGVPLQKQLYLWAVGMMDEILEDRIFVYMQDNTREFKKSAQTIKKHFLMASTREE